MSSLGDSYAVTHPPLLGWPMTLMQAFKDGDVRFLICTDVAARGTPRPPHTSPRTPHAHMQQRARAPACSSQTLPLEAPATLHLTTLP